MTMNSTVVPLRQPDAVEDPLTAVLRSGARRLLSQAIEAEAETFLAMMKGERMADGRDRVVRHGHAPARMVQTGIGPVEVQRVKLRDRGAGKGTLNRLEDLAREPVAVDLNIRSFTSLVPHDPRAPSVRTARM